MIVDGINSSSLSSSALEKVLPALKALGELLDQCAEELKTAPWLYKFLFARSIAQLELTADRVDGRVETLNLSQNTKVYDFLRQVTPSESAV